MIIKMPLYWIIKLARCYQFAVPPIYLQALRICFPIVGFTFDSIMCWFFAKKKNWYNPLNQVYILQENQMRDDTGDGESSLAIGLTRINDIMQNPNREKLFTLKIVCDFHFKFKHDMTNSFDHLIHLLLLMPYDNNKRLKNNQLILCCIYFRIRKQLISSFCFLLLWWCFCYCFVGWVLVRAFQEPK